MEVFFERLLVELLVIVAQLAIVRFVAWLRQRFAGAGAGGSAALEHGHPALAAA